MLKVKLTERRFAEKWCSNGHNATEAYLYVKPDVTRQSAKELGSRLLTNINVQQIIEEIQKDDSMKLEITRDSLLAEYEAIKERNLAEDDRTAIIAMQEQAKLLGLNAIEKHENINKNIDINEAAADPKKAEDIARAVNELISPKKSSK